MKIRALTGALTAATAALWVVATGLLIGSIQHRVAGVVTVFVALAGIGVGVLAGCVWLRSGQQRIGGTRSPALYRASVPLDRVVTAAIPPRPRASRRLDGPTEQFARPGSIALKESPAAPAEMIRTAFSLGFRIGRRGLD